MRIIAGKLKNRKLAVPKGLTTRPTSEKMRGAVFNKLQNEIPQSSFLDVFAGSGAMGLEALSRGAQRAVFLEKGREAVQCIKKNIADLDVVEEATLVRGDVFRSLEALESRQEQFDIIYVDPPYATTGESEVLSAQILQRIDTGDLLYAGGALLIEESSKAELQADSLQSLRLIKCHRFGGSHLFHFVKDE